ncbi:MAG: HAD-IC family P-type ATPase [Actinobacteria bacterium]|nr:HAD-IC family P-type ATPase [Actinomycetota bacterium]
MPGLSAGEVKQRIDRGQINSAPEHPSRSIAAILRENTLTLFNAILGTLLVLILAFGSLRDALFGLVLFGNMLIGIVQELRAKITLDRLSVLSASKARVIRDGKLQEIDIDGVVLDDILELQRGDQVVADGELLESSWLEIDESLLTGESEPIRKGQGDSLLSGSFTVSGSGVYRATAVGNDSFARKLTSEARRFKLVHSELRTGINKILAGVTWIMIPAGLVLFWREAGLSSFSESVAGSVAAMVGMVPEGLVLLTSVAFAVAVVVLGKRKVLVQELPAVEGLARVDTACFDKTGTLTEPGLHFNSLELIEGGNQSGPESQAVIEKALAALAADPASQNSTSDAIAAAFPAHGNEESAVSSRVPFSSERKWSSATIGGRSWYLGAPEILSDRLAGAGGTSSFGGRVSELAQTGKRVLLLASNEGDAAEEQLPEGLKAAAMVVLEEKIRGDAAETIDYFRQEGVAVKIISGDNVETVAAVAARAEVDAMAGPVDGRNLPEAPDGLAKVMEEHSIFGRVTAQQKLSMVKALQAGGHVVAMSGDGVNDTLAIKEADIGIAVGTGAAAPTKAVAELILLDGHFAKLPGVVAEGRRVIANIERVAYLFVTKTCYATLLTVAIAILGWPYPFLPRHLTLVGAITIGIPAFFLALAPSKERYRPGFIGRVLHFTIPAGALLAAGTLAAYALSRSVGADLEQSRTAATITLTVMGLCVLAMLARPLTFWRYVLILAMIAGLVIAAATPLIRDFLAFEFPSAEVMAESMGIAAACVAILAAGMKLTGWHPGGRASPE